MVTATKVITEADLMALEAKGIIREVSNGQWVDEKEIDPLEEIRHEAIKTSIVLKLKPLMQMSYFVVEVISPHETAQEVFDRLADYLRTGVKEIWQVYPTSRRVIVYRADGHHTVYNADQPITTDLLPGFELKVSEIFE